MTDPTVPSTLPVRSWRKALILPGLFFVGGIGATAWFLTSTETGMNLIAPAPSPIAVDPARIAAPDAVASPDVDARIAALEMRLSKAEALPPGMGGTSNASDRATGLVIAFAARRALERGQPLGPIEAELHSHFGSTKPHLIAAIVAAAQSPVTLEQLSAEFEKISPGLARNDSGWWAQLTGSLSALVTVRDSARVSDDPATLLISARSALDAGRVADALEQVAKLPGRAAANEWMAMAKRYVAADAALDALEASAFEGVPAPAPATAIVLPEPDTTGAAPASVF